MRGDGHDHGVGNLDWVRLNLFPPREAEEKSRNLFIRFFIFYILQGELIKRGW